MGIMPGILNLQYYIKALFVFSKGDFEGEIIINPFHATNFNRKIYRHLHYKNADRVITPSLLVPL